MSKDFDWTPDAINRLCAMWNDGVTVNEIGRRMGITKNSVVGKAGRLVAKGILAGRPSPIKGVSDPAKRAAIISRPKPEPLPPLSSVTAAASVEAPKPKPSNGSFRMLASAAPIVIPTVAPSSPPIAPVTSIDFIPADEPRQSMRRVSATCCWPIGTPGKKDFRMCDDVAVPGKPYCEEHCRIGYVKIRPRAEDPELKAVLRELKAALRAG